MPLFDYPIEELRNYRPERDEQEDFDAFWERTLAEVRQHPLDATFTPCDNGLSTVDSFDVTFAGWNGEPVRGWLQLPAQRSRPLPCVAEFIGYSGGRGLAHEHLLYASAGYAHLVMDTRGQGGDTGDAHAEPSGPHEPGFMTDGILDPDTYFYRRLMSDVVRAVDAARSHPDVDPSRVATTGRSQGGGLSLAAAGLVPDLAGSIFDVPFLCHYRRATEITDSTPYQEISEFCQRQPHRVEQVFRTLGYFDGLNFAARARAAGLFSVGMMDDVCPPSTVFAAHNHYAADKDITVWWYNAHEGGGAHQATARLAFLRKVFG